MNLMSQQLFKLVRFFVLLQIEKGRWWPAFTVLQSDNLQKGSSPLHDGLTLTQLIYSVESKEEPKFIEARYRACFMGRSMHIFYF
jgi:hypothetical protein